MALLGAALSCMPPLPSPPCSYFARQQLDTDAFGCAIGAAVYLGLLHSMLYQARLAWKCQYGSSMRKTAKAAQAHHLHLSATGSRQFPFSSECAVGLLAGPAGIGGRRAAMPSLCPVAPAAGAPGSAGAGARALSRLPATHPVRAVQWLQGSAAMHTAFHAAALHAWWWHCVAAGTLGCL